MQVTAEVLLERNGVNASAVEEGMKNDVMRVIDAMVYGGARDGFTFVSESSDFEEPRAQMGMY